jgi:2-haloalkanoic acid dehalogenase type II
MEFGMGGPKDYDWITFDCYGTLIDWEGGISAAFEKVAKTSGAAFDRSQVLKLYHKYEAEEEFGYRRYKDILSRVARHVCAELGFRTADFGFLLESLSRWRPFAETNQALERLARNHKLGILSNIDNDLFAITQRHFTVPFDLVLTAEQVGSYKPEAKHFQEAKKKIGSANWVHAAESFYHDIIPCNRLGIETVWINRKQEPPKDPKIQPKFVAFNLTMFANWIEGVD